MNAKELMARIMTPTNWKAGDRVMTNRFGPGVVEYVRDAEGAMDGIQHVAVKLDKDGSLLVSMGGELADVGPVFD